MLDFRQEGMTLLAVSTQEVIEAILGSIDEAIHAVDENGITIFYNSVAAKHDGSKIEKVLGKHLLEAFPSLSKGNEYIDESTRYKNLSYIRYNIIKI